MNEAQPLDPARAGSWHAVHRDAVAIDDLGLSEVLVQAWDAAERMIEDYEYRELRVNVGLTDRDFDTGNPAYNF